MKCALATASALLLCAAAKPWLPMLEVPTTKDAALIAINRYLSGSTADAVLLGSSLTARIKEEYFTTLRVRNLGIAGGSPLTGLRIILLNPQSIPKTILVETNLLSNVADEALIGKLSGSERNFFFSPVRMAVAAYENWRHGPAGESHSSAYASRLLQEPPQKYNNQVYLDRVARGYGQDATATLQSNVDQLTQLVSSARALGVRVLLFELPYPDQLDQTRIVQDTRRIVSERFWRSNEWLHLMIAQSELRWPDGAHFDERSAVMTARAIEQAVSDPSSVPR
jgi:hypothetical protein